MEKLKVVGEDVSWKLFHEIQDVSKPFFKPAQSWLLKCCTQELQPNLSDAMAIFDETIVVASKKYISSINEVRMVNYFKF